MCIYIYIYVYIRTYVHIYTSMILSLPAGGFRGAAAALLGGVAAPRKHRVLGRRGAKVHHSLGEPQLTHAGQG